MTQRSNTSHRRRRRNGVGAGGPARRAVLWSAIVMPLGVLLPITAPATARAANPISVPIPQHEVPAGLTLIGASSSGAAVEQASVGPAIDLPVERVYTGALGSSLALRRDLLRNNDHYGPVTPLTVAGRNLAWYITKAQANHLITADHRLDLVTGQDTVDSNQPPPPGAFNGTNWFSQQPSVFNAVPQDWDDSLRLIHPTTRTQPSSIDVLIPKVAGVSGQQLAADQTGVLRLTTRVVPGQPTHHDLDHFDLRAGTDTPLISILDPITKIAMSADTVVWVTTNPDESGPAVIHQMPRYGGAASAHAEPDPGADLDHLAVGAAGVAYVTAAPDGSGTSLLRVLRDGAVRDVPLPYGVASGVAAVGDQFLTAIGGLSDAGVYAVSGSTVTRVATVPGATRQTAAWSFSDSMLRYTEQSDVVTGGRPIWERSVTGKSRFSFSAEQALPDTSGPFAFSAGRGVAGAPGENGTWELIDRGTVGAEIEARSAPGAVPNISGPYILIGGRVFRPDGEQIYTEPGIAPSGSAPATDPDDIFGPTVIYARTVAGGGIGIWSDDVESTAPVRLSALPSGCDRPPTVSVWGRTVAWASGCGSLVTVRDLTTGVSRTVPALPSPPRTLSLSEGTLSWLDRDGTAHLLDLASPGSVPVTLPGSSEMIAVDDHRIARDLHPNSQFAQDLRMQLLPFPERHAPRLIAGLGPFGFSPDGDGHADTWAPQFDVTKPLRSTDLTIADGSGRKVATLTSPALDGSVRGLSWNGLSSKGVRLPAGTYRWTLTGRAADGDGRLIAADGSPAVNGTVEIDLPHQ